MTASPWLAIVVPVRNGMATLTPLVDALDSFAREDGLSVLFVDDASADESAAYLRSRGYSVLQRPARGGPAAARNQGVRATTAPWILFLDADTRPPANTLERVRKSLAVPEAVAMVGVYAPEPVNSGFWPQYKATQAEFYHRSTDVEEISFIWAAMAAVKRDAFLEAGGFDESYGGADLEDVELGHRMAAHGKILLDREFVVGHHFADSLRTNARDHFHRGRLWVELYLRRGRFENYLCTANMGASRVALVSAPAFAVLGCLSAAPWPFVGLALVAAAFYGRVAGGLLSLARRRGGWSFALKVTGAELVLSAVLVAASASAMAGAAAGWITAARRPRAPADSDA